MTTPEGAAGIFARRRSAQAERPAVGDEAAQSGFVLTFRQGRYYVVVELVPPAPKAAATLEHFARAVSSKIAGSGRPR